MEGGAARLDARESSSDGESYGPYSDEETNESESFGFVKQGTEGYLEDAKLRLASLRIRMGADAHLSKLQNTFASLFQPTREPSVEASRVQRGTPTTDLDLKVQDFQDEKDHLEKLAKALNKCVARNKLLAEAEREVGEVLVEYGHREKSDFHRAIESFGQAHMFVAEKRLDMVAMNEQRTTRPLVTHLRTAVDDANVDVEAYLNIQHEISVLKQAISDREGKSKTSFTDSIEREAEAMLHELEELGDKKTDTVSNKLRMLRSKTEVDYAGILASYMRTVETFEKMAFAELSGCDEEIVSLQESVKHKDTLAE